MKGNWNRTLRLLNQKSDSKIERILANYGRKGVDALSAATPIESSKTAQSWDFDVHSTGSGYKLVWTNSNINQGVPIAIILQYGHGTGTGGWVEGRDYINPAMRPIFDSIVNDILKAVNS